MAAQIARKSTRLPRNLGPKAKRSLLTAAGGTVRCTVEIASAARRDVLEGALQTLGAHILSWDKVGRTVTLEAPVSRLAEIAGTRGIVYIDTADRYTF